MQIQLVSLQSVLFLTTIDLSNRLEAANLLSQGTSFFDGPPTILPFPDDAPPEIPRIILKSKEENYVCNVTSNRIDFVFEDRKSESGSEIKDFEKQYFSNLHLLVKAVYNLKARSSRLGLVAKYLGFPKMKTVKFLIEQYLKNIESDSVEAQVHFLKLGKAAKYNVNIWTRLITQRQKNSKSDRLLIVSDINTSLEEKHDINVSMAINFFKEAFSTSQREVNRTLSLD